MATLTCGQAIRAKRCAQDALNNLWAAIRRAERAGSTLSKNGQLTSSKTELVWEEVNSLKLGYCALLKLVNSADAPTVE